MNDFDNFVERLKNTRPSCLADCVVQPTDLPEPWDENPISVWRLECRCGSTSGRLLGYSLKDLDSEYDGPLVLLSPLGFECAECSAVSEFLDTDIHGFHADLARRDGDDEGSSKLRGAGERLRFPCPKCEHDKFNVTLGFVFWNADELAEEFDERWEDLFNVFLCFAKCQQCGFVSQPTDFGKL